MEKLLRLCVKNENGYIRKIKEEKKDQGGKSYMWLKKIGVTEKERETEWLVRGISETVENRWQILKIKRKNISECEWKMKSWDEEKEWNKK